MKNKSSKRRKQILAMIKAECTPMGQKTPLNYCDGYALDYQPKPESYLYQQIESFTVVFSNQQDINPIEIVCNPLWIGVGKPALKRVEDLEAKYSCPNC